MTSDITKRVRPEDARLLMGRGKFVDDIHLDRMVAGCFVRSTRSHANIVSIDASRALAAGALLVLVAQDLPFLNDRYAVRYWHPAIRGGLPKLLAVDRVRFVGEPIAFVVAQDRYTAEDMAGLVDVEYEELPAVGSVAAALQPDQPLLHDEWPGNIAASYRESCGDPIAALAKSPRRMSRSFSFARQAPLPLETRGCVADFDRERNCLTAWVSTQTHFNVRQNLAAMLRMPEDKVRVIAEDVGGGFGSKSRAYPEEIIAAFASKKLRRPVKWIEDRFEHLQATTHSRAIDIAIEVGYDETGRLHALTEQLTLDIGAYVFTSGIITTEVAAAQMAGPYKIPHALCDVRCVGTNKPPIGTYRGAGQPESAFPLECVLDQIAADVGISAAQVRQRNLVRPEDMPYYPGTSKAGTKIRFDSGDYPAVLRRAVERSGYHEEVETLAGSEVAAWGLACGVETAGLVSGESAHIRVDTNGEVIVRSGMTTQGQGHRAAYARVCADVLGVDLDAVTVQMGDTALVPFGRGAFGTRGTVIGANAVAGAAGKLREKILRHASILLQSNVDGLSLVAGRIRRADGRMAALSLGNIAASVLPGGPLFEGAAALEQEYVYSDSSMTFGFGVQAIRAAVDLRTGIFRILDFYLVHDAGVVIDEGLLRGQLIGGAVEGIGGATLSELLYGDDGQLLTGSLADYLVMTSTCAPPIRVDHYAKPATTTPLGVRGAGEGSVIPTAPALVNALMRALGTASADCCRVPIKPETIFRIRRKSTERTVQASAGAVQCDRSAT